MCLEEGEGRRILFPSRAAGQALWLPRAFMVSNKLSYKNPSLEFYFSKEPGPAWKLGISISYFLTGQQMQEKRAKIQWVLQILPLSLPEPASEGSFPGCGELVLWDQLSPVSQGGNLAWNGSAGHRESSLKTEGKSGPRVQTKRGERLGRHLSTPFFTPFSLLSCSSLALWTTSREMCAWGSLRCHKESPRGWNDNDPAILVISILIINKVLSRNSFQKGIC